jgi:protein disulfide-isomerase
MPSRTSILETLKEVVVSPPKIKPKSTIGSFEKLFFDIRSAISGHKWLSIGLAVLTVLGLLMGLRRRMRRSRGGFFRLDEKDGLLGGGINGKVD